MIRQDIRIGDFSDNGSDIVTYKYIVDLYKAGSDIQDHHAAKFVMLRRYTIINDIACDTDLYIIDKDLYDEHRQDIVFPITNKSFVGFSSNILSFTDDKNAYNLLERHADKTFTPASIPCDVLRVYHPDNRKELQSIIYVDAVVGSIKIHLYCKPYLSHESHSEEDFSIGMVKYSEYIDCFIPNIEYLLSGKVYYEENISLLKTGLQEGGEVTSELLCTPENGESIDRVYAALKLYTIPYVIEEGDGTEYEQYKRFIIDINDSVAQDYVAFPLRVTIAPYDYIDDLTGLYINTSKLDMNSDIMQDKAYMSLAAKVGFDNDHNPSLVCVFQFPSKNLLSNFREAYEYFYRVDLKDYTGIVEYDEDADEDDYVEQKQCGFILSVYTDYSMKSLLKQEIFELDDPESQLDDFAFQLNGMFNSWDELPDTLVMRASFIDRWLGNIIVSNPVTVCPKSFKCIINDDSQSRPIVSWDGQERQYETIQDMDLSNINFIDKIHCTVRRKSEESKSVYGQSGTPKVLYKPVFYRTQDLQNITLRSGLTQNIGVALPEYMTKVETFKMHIGNQDIVESARNDIYAIFSVNASIIGTETGTYHITNQDGEYISSGTYSIIR